MVIIDVIVNLEGFYVKHLTGFRVMCTCLPRACLSFAMDHQSRPGLLCVVVNAPASTMLCLG